jgi:Transglutaminase-like superfamily
MKRLIGESYWLLLKTELLLLFGDFRVLHGAVRNGLVRPAATETPASEELCRSMDLACVFYPKRVMCLQRSAATTMLLRRHGFGAEMVIGTQVLPLKSHAWVEIDGRVVNDKSYVPHIYSELERC